MRDACKGSGQPRLTSLRRHKHHAGACGRTILVASHKNVRNRYPYLERAGTKAGSRFILSRTLDLSLRKGFKAISCPMLLSTDDRLQRRFGRML